MADAFSVPFILSTENIKDLYDLYGNAGKRFKAINNSMDFSMKKTLSLLTWFVLASCVVIFPIRCDLSHGYSGGKEIACNS